MDTERARSICLMGRGAACCRYLAGDADGMFCAKHYKPLADAIDQRVAAGTMVAQGDNCEGMRPH